MRKTIVRHGLVFALLPFLCLLAACSDDNSDVPADKVHPLSWSEPTNFTNADFHGKVVVAEGNDACRQCHGLDLTGSGDVLSCTYCHDDIDGGHLPGNNLPEVHGVRAIANFQICKLCHGDDYLGGIVGVSCAQCHDASTPLQWPHDPGNLWLNNASVNFHGDAANADMALCAKCHGSDFRGGTTGVSCFTCHFDETGADYPSGLTHHQSHKNMEAHVAICNACHNVNRTYGNSPNACHDCHGDGD